MSASSSVPRRASAAVRSDTCANATTAAGVLAGVGDVSGPVSSGSVNQHRAVGEAPSRLVGAHVDDDLAAHPVGTPDPARRDPHAGPTPG